MNQKTYLALAFISTLLGCELLSGQPSHDPTAVTQLKATTPLRPASSQRIVAIGDIHGDLAAAMKALQLAGAVDAKGRWIGGNMIVVQTGDEIDRGDDDRQVIDLFERLRTEAQAAGGSVYPLSGNHEAMNVYLDFRYVTDGSFKDFTENLPSTMAPIPDLPSHQQARAAAFLPGGRYAKILATRPVMLVVGNTAFAHGGIRPEHVKAGIDSMNQEVAAWMSGKSERPSFVKDSKGPLWMRDYSADTPTSEACGMLKETLAALGAKRMVVGHSVQDNGINAACQNQVWRIDVGLSSYYKGKYVQVLDIQGDNVKVLSAPR
ncbi:shewanella-like protein phosphatase [Oligoflexus tunisiensis]|uniref:shewanella-like protein phosphatase n=1 Tax=Oligoflexus tunisiensis TaxID=708132 RepID=UPI00114D3574|nr:shewanella-like protein phosphatase [Oligoflexus tunisiensis]